MAYIPPGPGPGWMPPPPPPPAPQPGVIPLRPLQVSDLLGGAFSTVGRYWKQIYGFGLAVVTLALLAMAAVSGLGLVLVWGTLDDLDSGSDPLADGQVAQLVTTGGLVLLLLVCVGGYALAALHAAYAVAVSYAVLGRDLPARELWRAARPRTLSVYGVQLLSWLLVGGLTLLGYGLFVFAVLGMLEIGPNVLGLHGRGGPALTLAIPVLFGSIALASFCYVRLALGPSAATLEKQPPIAAMRRSWHLVRGSWWRVLGITLLVSILCSIADQLLQTVLMLTGGVSVELLTGIGGDDPSVGSVVAVVAVFAAVLAFGSMLTMPFPYVVATLLYLDLRIRREGLDLTLAASAGLPPHRPAAPGAYAGHAPPWGTP